MKELFNELIANNRFAEGSSWKRTRLNAGQTIIKKGESGNTLYFIEEGAVRVLGDIPLDDDQRIAPGLSDLVAGAVFGEVCLYESAVRTASVVSITDVCLLEVRGDMLSVFLDDHPVQGYLFLKTLFQTMSVRLGVANDRIGSLLTWGIKAHEIDEFL